MKIKKGANLFWGGVNNIEGLQEIEMDEVVGIRMASDKRYFQFYKKIELLE